MCRKCLQSSVELSILRIKKHVRTLGIVIQEIETVGSRGSCTGQSNQYGWSFIRAIAISLGSDVVGDVSHKRAIKSGIHGYVGGGGNQANNIQANSREYIA